MRAVFSIHLKRVCCVLGTNPSCSDDAEYVHNHFMIIRTSPNMEQICACLEVLAKMNLKMSAIGLSWNHAVYMTTVHARLSLQWLRHCADSGLFLCCTERLSIRCKRLHIHKQQCIIQWRCHLYKGEGS